MGHLTKRSPRVIPGLLQLCGISAKLHTNTVQLTTIYVICNIQSQMNLDTNRVSDSEFKIIMRSLIAVLQKLSKQCIRNQCPTLPHLSDVVQMMFPFPYLLLS